MTLAEKITALRGERKLSQGDVAEKLDVSRQSVSKWETGQAVPELADPVQSLSLRHGYGLAALPGCHSVRALAYTGWGHRG